ncbi:hypothetical protein M2350_001506 [Candidatus Fervidibacter sacchari]|uniref:Uncharacterized protein n=1 Tax=Candidatus Fervidibacter sacchari TaxID=1448929 RepID=A0ABT2ENT9_9BACT|nr:hypothetical protein [Candidatus Fervidibacter sacchari]
MTQSHFRKISPSKQLGAKISKVVFVVPEIEWRTPQCANGFR